MLALASPLAELLGAKLAEKGSIETDDSGQTSVPGLYATAGLFRGAPVDAPTRRAFAMETTASESPGAAARSAAAILRQEVPSSRRVLRGVHAGRSAESEGSMTAAPRASQ
jgi:hypothetical protein